MSVHALVHYLWGKECLERMDDRNFLNCQEVFGIRICSRTGSKNVKVGTRRSRMKLGTCFMCISQGPQRFAEYSKSVYRMPTNHISRENLYRPNSRFQCKSQSTRG